MNIHSAYQQVRSFLGGVPAAQREETPPMGGSGVTEPSTCVYESLEPRLLLQGGPVPILSVSAIDAEAAEEGPDTAVFRLALDEPQNEAITARFRLGGNAQRNRDYELLVDGEVFTGNAVTVRAGQTFVSVVMRPVDDTLLENTEMVRLALVNANGYRLSADAAQRSASATIEDNEPTLSLSAVDPEAAEEGLNTGTIRITRDGSTQAPVMASLRVGGIARRGVDYDLSVNGMPVEGNTVLIPSGCTFVDVAVQPIDDMRVERTETVVLSLANSREYNVAADAGGRTATVEILDNEPTVTIVATDAEASETGPGTASFQITREETTQGDLDVAFRIGGNARRNQDYDLLVGDEVVNGSTVTIPDGAMTVDLVVRPIDDVLVERPETVVVALRNTRQYVLSEDRSFRRASAVIEDNESAISIVAVDAEASEEGPSTATVQIARDGTTQGDLPVRFRANGSARRNVDYEVLVGGEVVSGNSVTIPDGQASVNVVLRPIDDELVEPTETVILSVLNTREYRLAEDPADRRASATIEDNEPTLSIMVVEDQASEEGPEPAVFRIMREGSNQREVVANLRMNGSARNGRDVELMINGQPVEGNRVTIPAGQDSVDVVMMPVDDNIVEPTKTMTVTLRRSRNHVMPENRALMTGTAELTDNEPTVAVTTMDAEAGEPDNEGVFRIAREDSTQGPLDVVFGINGNARRNRDYELVVNDEVLTGNTVTIPDGENTVDVIVRPLDDTIVERTESVILALRNTRAYLRADDPNLRRATVEIADDEPMLSLSVLDEEASEEGPDPAVFLIHRAGSTLDAVQARIRVGGTARRNVDYELLVNDQVVTNNIVTIPAGANSVTVTARPIDDNFVENEETIIMALLNRRDYKLAEDRDQLRGSATLEDNEPTVSVTSMDADAGEQGPNPAAFRVSRDGSSQGPLDVTFRLRGTARPGGDYDLIAHGEPLTGNTVTIPDGNTFVDVTMMPIDDDVVEPTETMVFGLVNTNRYVLTDDVEQRSVTVEIADNEPVLSVMAIDEQAGEEGLKQGVFRVIREGSRQQPVTVRFRMSGNATRNRDYQLTVGGNVLDGNTVTIPEGQGFVDIVLKPIDDDQVEMREMATLSLVRGNGYVLVEDRALWSDTIEILDNDTNA
ncbi:MAG: Calx-beta domain-containing protein [Planctomycetota bacterium]